MQAATSHLENADPVLALIIKRIGPCAFAVREPTFETLARSITFQQLNGKAAGTIFARVKKVVGRRFTAPAFLRLTAEELRACGLSRQKIASLTDLAQRVARREINFRKLTDLSDEEVIRLLSEVRGVGIWTAQMFLMFALGRLNIMPVSDLGIRLAVRKAYALADLPKPADLIELSKNWHPYCSVACWYLWRSLDQQAEI